MNKKIVHDALILLAFTLILGFALGLVYQVTKDPIAAVEAKTKQDACMAVFADASTFEEMEIDKAEAADFLKNAGFKDSVNEVMLALDDAGSPIGYVITIVCKDGSQGSITMSVGISNDGTCNGYAVTDSSETPGLGTHIVDEYFYSQFQGKTVDAFTVVKSDPMAENEILAITGATISSRAVTNGVNAAILYAGELGGAQ